MLTIRTVKNRSCEERGEERNSNETVPEWHENDNQSALFREGPLTVAGAATMGTGLLTHSSPLLAQGGTLTTGDAALLRFAAAAEILETDFWVQ